MDFSKYRNKSFAEVSQDIQAKYAERYDPISQRGLNADMTQLRNKQEEVKASMMSVNNEGVSPEMPQQDQGTFNRAASQPYNQKFYDGGWIEENEYSPEPINIGNGSQGVYGRDPLSYAPMLGGVLALINNKRPEATNRHLIDESLATRTSPRQTQFNNIDMSQIERQIAQQARGFTGANANVSGGNAGAFMANELGNQGNIMDAIASARIQAQQSDQRTAAMNAQEQARIDQFNQGQDAQQAQIQSQNARLNFQYDDLDARNEGAWRTNRNDAYQSILGNLGAIGRENTQNNMILKALGYDSMGNYGGQGRNSINDVIDFIQKLRKRN